MNQRPANSGLGVRDRVAIIGAGMGGIAAALRLSAFGFQVDVFEKEPAPGGKMREILVGGEAINAGPTVFTMRWVFDELLDASSQSLEDVLEFIQADVLARHAWENSPTLDLFADIDQSADAIGAFAGAANAKGYKQFCADSAAIFHTLQRSYIATQRPSPIGLTRNIGPLNIGAMLALRPFSTLWNALGDYFPDHRMRQLFGRYATYCGSSPFAAPATLMLVAHVEQDGVFIAKGGMHGLAKALAGVATSQGVTFHYGSSVDRILHKNGRAGGLMLSDGRIHAAGAVIFNGDASALGSGLLKDAGFSPPRIAPKDRSLSAVTWGFKAKISGFKPAHHTVLFSNEYQSEFDAIFKRGQVPQNPTTYLCLPDRQADGTLMRPANEGERVFCLINAPANGDTHDYSPQEIDQCLNQTKALMQRCGLTLEMMAEPQLAASPTEFNKLFPGSGGALYGPASHGWMASFKRQGARTKLPGLYLAGGSVHPGPGVPMAALSGRLAAESLMSDRSIMPRFRRAVTSGGMPTA
jgi:1-hydroxycarotenoid 3,4-desaturase